MKTKIICNYYFWSCSTYEWWSVAVCLKFVFLGPWCSFGTVRCVYVSVKLYQFKQLLYAVCFQMLYTLELCRISLFDVTIYIYCSWSICDSLVKSIVYLHQNLITPWSGLRFKFTSALEDDVIWLLSPSFKKLDQKGGGSRWWAYRGWGKCHFSVKGGFNNSEDLIWVGELVIVPSCTLHTLLKA